jgi:hypothetical protein
LAIYYDSKKVSITKKKAVGSGVGGVGGAGEGRKNSPERAGATGYEVGLGAGGEPVPVLYIGRYPAAYGYCILAVDA